METNFKLPDNKSKAGKILGLGVLAVAGLLVYSKLLPFLLNVVWDTVSLGVGIGVTAILGYILTSKKFWRRMKIILDTLGQVAFGWFIEMNRWNILDLQLSKAEDNRNDSKKSVDLLRGQEAGLKRQLQEQNDVMEQAIQEMKICERKMALNPNDEDTALLYETSTTNFANAKEFIEKVSPTYKDIQTLCEFGDKAYRKSGNAIANMRSTLKIKRATFDAVTTGQSAMGKVLKAFAGDSEINIAAEKAAKSLEVELCNGIGAIKNSMQLTSQFMNARDLGDAAKVARAAEAANNMNIETLDYVDVKAVGDLHAGKGVGNKYLDYLKK